MDGNGRWAKHKMLPRNTGHLKGIDTIQMVIEESISRNVEHLTLFALSKENLTRPLNELDYLMGLFQNYLINEVNKINERDIKLNFIGDLYLLPKDLQKLIQNAVSLTSSNKKLQLNIAVCYSGRWDIIQATKKIMMEMEKKIISSDELTEEIFSNYLSTSRSPDPDLIIRTGGEVRLSNFLLWQCAYSEIYITNKYWPEFTKEDFYDALHSYSKRERRFGRITEQLQVVT